MKYIIFLLFFSFLTNVKGQLNNSLHFDGVNDYVNLNSLAPAMVVSSAYTVEFWMKANRFDQTTFRPTIFSISKSNSGAANTQNILTITFGGESNSDGFLCISTEANGTVRKSIKNIGDNKCHHIAYVNPGSGIGALYVDGVFVLDVLILPPAMANTSRISLAQRYSGGSTSQFFKGEIGNARIWSVARTASEIQTNLNAQFTGAEPNLLALFNFNQGIAGGNNTTLTTLANEVPGGNSGSLMNLALEGNSSNFITPDCVGCAVGSQVIDSTVCFGTTIIFPDNTSQKIYNNFTNVSSLLTAEGCDSTITTNVNVVPGPLFSLGPDFEMCFASPETIGVPYDTTFTYLWNTGDTTSYITILVGGNYNLTRTNSCGFSFTDNVFITQKDCSCGFYLPNTFTPDDNEVNQYFRPVYSCEISNYEMQIYNRRGKMIFQNFEPEVAWDGYYEGELVPSNIYTYKVSYIDHEGKEVKVFGHVNVLK